MATENTDDAAARALRVGADLEALLLQLIPNLAQEWEGASEEEIAEIAQQAGHPLPAFYRWFLMRMGRSMGPLQTRVDLSVTQPREDWLDSQGRLIIGFIPDGAAPGMDGYLALPLVPEARDDAPVYRLGLKEIWPSLREMLASWAFRRFSGREFSQVCNGSVWDRGKDVVSQIRPILLSLGFIPVMHTSEFCGLFERDDAVLSFTCVHPKEESLEACFFKARGKKTALFQFLDEVAQANIEIHLDGDAWAPPVSIEDERAFRWHEKRRQLDGEAVTHRRHKPAFSKRV